MGDLYNIMSVKFVCRGGEEIECPEEVAKISVFVNGFLEDNEGEDIEVVKIEKKHMQKVIEFMTHMNEQADKKCLLSQSPRLLTTFLRLWVIPGLLSSVKRLRKMMFSLSRWLLINLTLKTLRT